MNALSIRQKLLLTVLIPVVSIVALSSVIFLGMKRHYDDSKKTVLVKQFELAATKLLYELQIERGSSAAGIEAHDADLMIRSKAARARTDKVLETMHDVNTQIRKSGYEALHIHVNAIEDIQKEITVLRSAIDLGRIKVDELFGRYTRMIHHLYDLVEFESMENTGEETVTEAAHKEILQLQIVRGEKRATIARFLGREHYAASLGNEVSKLIAVEAFLYTGPHIREELRHYAWYDSYMQLEQRIKDVEDAISEFLYVNWEEDTEKEYATLKDMIGIRPDVWFTMVTKQMELLQQVIEEHLSEHRTLAEVEAEKTYERLIALMVATLFIALISLYFSYRVGEKIIANIRQIKEGLGNFFDLLEHKRERMAPIVVSSQDDLRLMADNLNKAIEAIVYKKAIDEEFIEEATHVIMGMEAGSFDERIYFDPQNPSLIQMKQVFNRMMEIIDERIRATTRDLEAHNIQLEQELQERLGELTQLESGINRSMYSFELERDYRIVEINHPLLARIGWNEHETIRNKITKYFQRTQENLEVVERLMSEVSEKGMGSAKVNFFDRFGQVVNTEMTLVALRDSEGETYKIIGLCVDITDVIEARQRAEKAERVKGDFLANMSHEIRTPLNAIMGFVAILQRTITDPKHRKHIDVIHRSGESLLGIINDILDFSKIQSGTFKVETIPFSPLKELSGIVDLYVSRMQEKNILFLAYIDITLPASLNGDILRIKQVVSNLLSNAVKFTPENGEVKLSASYKEGALVCKIQDNGIGMNEEQLSRIFTPF